MSKEEEQRQRIEAMAEVMREKTMREAESAGASRRPDGVKHLLDLDKDEDAVDRAMREALPQYAANYDDDRDEWGGPKGEEPTRFRLALLSNPKTGWTVRAMNHDEQLDPRTGLVVPRPR